MNRALDRLLSDLHGALHPDHLADLRRSGLTDDTIARQRIRSVPPAMLGRLLGFDPPAVVSAYLIPFADPRGGWMNHVRVKVFPPSIDRDGHAVKYLQPRRSGVRLYFPLATLAAVRHGADRLYICEGEKKSLAVAQQGFATVGICGIEGWHVRGTVALHPDLDDVGIAGRDVHLIPDSDHQTNPDVADAVGALAIACRDRGAANVRIVIVPPEYKGIDDYLVGGGRP